ncbi:MAG: DUF6308 family protein, partial [Candidatus Hodarchaeales archaeon]
MGIRLRDDVYFDDPEPRIREYCDIEVYQGYDDQHTVDDLITQRDIDSANNLYAMINRYDPKEGARILDQAPKIATMLGKISNEAIYLYEDKDWENAKPKIKALLASMASIHGVGLAKATKILHLKRPRLFPVLDSYVVQFLTGKTYTSSTRDTELALKGLDISRELIRDQVAEFTELQMKLGNLPIPLTEVRLFDILCWSAYKWDILGRTTAPNGKTYKSLINYQRASTKPTPNKTTRKPSTKEKASKKDSMAPVIVVGFFDELSGKARYRVRGEKPLAVLAVLQYLYDTKQMGVKFLHILDYPYYEKVRKTFLKLAEEYGSTSDPASS